MSCFLIGENTHTHEIGEQLNQMMELESNRQKESFSTRLKQPI